MKKILTVLLSLSVAFAVAQERGVTGPKTIDHGPLACPSLVMTPVDNTTVFPADLVESILGTDVVSYSNVTFAGATGANGSAGLFNGGTNAGIGVEEGIVLSSGTISNAIGPNSSIGISVNLGIPGDADLTILAAQQTYDATVLEFDFVPLFDELFIEFVFGSDEYTEWINQYNDVFAFYLNGVNIAVVPSTVIPISVNTINPSVNSSYYKNNEAYPGPFCNEMDGFTTVMVATGNVTPNGTNHIKLAISDSNDALLDSWVFFKSEGFSGVDPEVPISNWALFIGIGLILIFAVIRFRRLV